MNYQKLFTYFFVSLFVVFEMWGPKGVTRGTMSGWGMYADTQYTSISPFSVAAGDKVTLPNNALNKNETEKPKAVTEYYTAADSTITGRIGDGILITIEFKVTPTSANTSRLYVSIDIGGAVGEIYPRDFGFSKGAGSVHYYLSSFGAYTLDTWQANGGKIKVQPIGGGVDIYDIRYVVQTTHRANW